MKALKTKRRTLNMFKIIKISVVCLIFSSCMNYYPDQKDKSIDKSSILLLKIQGEITSETSESFAKNIRKYASQEKIKGVLVRVDSPGGTVAASQEINSAIAEVKDLYKKKIYVSGGDIVASGGVYSILSADKIFVNKGTLFGSIGVVMAFQNLGELARWAKMEFYNIKSGEFKDSGHPFRAMTLRERELFENLLETVHEQFKKAVIDGRKLDPKQVELFADGRIFSGEEGVDYGLADTVGTFNDAIREIGESTGLGSDPHLFDPDLKSPYEKFFDSFSANSSSALSVILKKFDRVKALSAKPLYLLPYSL